MKKIIIIASWGTALTIFIIIIVSFLFDEYQNSIYNSVKTDTNYYSKNYPKIKSPDGKKSLIIFENGYEKENASTQIMVNFGFGGGGIFSAEGTDLGITAEWKDDKSIVIKLKKEYKIVRKDTKIQFLNDIINIEYIDE